MHVEEVALLCPGSVTSPLCPRGQARETGEVSEAPPLLPFPYKGSEVVEHWTEAGEEQSPQTTNLGPSLHSCSVAGPWILCSRAPFKAPSREPAEADPALPNSQIFLEVGSKLYSAMWLLFLI